MTINWLYSASGLGVGALVGMTGVGGGSLMTPLLVLLFGIHPATAVGTDLLYAASTKAVGTLAHGSRGTVVWRVVLLLALGSMPAASITIYVLVRLGSPTDAVSHLISIVLGGTLLLTSVCLLVRGRLMRWASRTGSTWATPTRAAQLTVLTGFVLGVLVSISSVGAGAIGVTVLILLYPTMPTARVVGTDIAHAVPLTLVAGFGHWLIGAVDWPLYTSLLIGSVPGILIGSLVATRVPDGLLRPIMAAVLVITGAKLLT